MSCKENLKKLTILHSNDMHGDFLPESINDELIGGVSLLAGYISKIRSEEKNVIYCMAGDMFSGSVIDTEYRGISTVEIMNALAPDVVTLGNHEVDYGIAHLLFLEKCARFSIINANMYLKMNHKRLFTPCKLVNAGGIKVLFIGLLTPDTLNQTKKEALIGTYLSMTDPKEEVARICSEQKTGDVDLTILLTHIGIDEDRKLAAELDPSYGVDIIIGGHSHTFMEQPEKINDILIVQAGCGTDHIGRFDITVDTAGKCVADYMWECKRIDSGVCQKNKKTEKILNSFRTETDRKYGRLMTELDRPLTNPRRNMQTELGGFFADILMEELGTDIMLMASGSVRSQSLGPTVTFKDFIEAFPFDDSAYVIKVNGKTLKKMLLRVYRDDAWEGKHTEFYQLSEGLEVTYSVSKHEITEMTFKGHAVGDDDQFSIGLQEYHYINRKDSFDLDDEDCLVYEKPRRAAASCQNLLNEYFERHPHITCSIKNRLTLE